MKISHSSVSSEQSQESAARDAEPVPVSPAEAGVDVPEFRRNPPRLLNLKELCVILDISERHARHLVAERKLPVIRLGHRLLFDTARVFSALERLTV